MDSEQHKSIRQSLEPKSTEELHSLWIENNRENWTSEAMDVAREILLRRGEEIRPQKATHIIGPNSSSSENQTTGRSYDIYQISEDDEAEVIKVGFSWPAFFFFDTWILSGGLWKAWGIIILQRLVILVPLAMLYQ